MAGWRRLKVPCESGVPTSRSDGLLDRKVDAHPVEEWRLADPLGGVEKLLPDLALQQGHIEL